MKLLSFYYHIRAFFKRIILFFIFRNKLCIGSHTTWRKSLSITIGKKGIIKIGKNCFFNNYCSVNALQEINIGDGTLFGENVKLYDHNHRFRNTDVPIKAQGYKTAPIRIGSHCWIGSNVVILKGVTIGNNCVIGAGSVITQNIPSNSVVTLKENILKTNKLVKGCNQ